MLAAGLFAASAQASDRVIVFAAASLKNALDEVGKAWLAETGRQAAFSYAATSALARQIEQGAPADIFVSADLDWMSTLNSRGLVKAGSIVELLGNEIVLVAPKDSPAQAAIAPGFDLAGIVGDGRLAMADVKAVPAGKYGKAALEALGVWNGIEPRIAMAENVRAALKLVALGEAPAGIVYATDAKAEPGVRILGTFPAGSHPPITYSAALVAASGNADAPVFLDFLQGGKAQAIFAQQGFVILKPADK